MKKRKPQPFAPMSPDGWMRLLEDVLWLNIFEKVDSIDISWDGLNMIFNELNERERLALQLRYSNELTYKEIAKILPRKDKLKGPLSPMQAKHSENKALRKLQHLPRYKRIIACIAGFHNLEERTLHEPPYHPEFNVVVTTIFRETIFDD